MRRSILKENQKNTRRVSIGQRSSSVVNLLTSLVELIQVMVYKLTHDTFQNFEKKNEHTILRSATHGIPLARALHLIQGKQYKYYNKML